MLSAIISWHSWWHSANLQPWSSFAPLHLGCTRQAATLVQSKPCEYIVNMTNVVKICTNQSMIAWLGDPQGGVNNIAPLRKKKDSVSHTQRWKMNMFQQDIALKLPRWQRCLVDKDQHIICWFSHAILQHVWSPEGKATFGFVWRMIIPRSLSHHMVHHFAA